MIIKVASRKFARKRLTAENVNKDKVDTAIGFLLHSENAFRKRFQQFSTLRIVFWRKSSDENQISDFVAHFSFH